MSEQALFVHSTATGPFMWRPYLGTLPERLGAIAPANRGYAATDPLPRGSAFSVHQEVEHLLAQLPPGTEGLHLVAHSYGGFAALTLAVSAMQDQGISVRSLWLYEPVLFGSLRAESDALTPEVAVEVEALYGDGHSMLDEHTGGDETWLMRFIDYWNHDGMWASMPDKAKAMTRAVSWKMFREVCSVSQEPLSFAHYAVDIPMTLVHGAQTRPPSRAMVRRLSEVNPHAVVESLDGLGHMGLLTTPEPVAASLQRHWARVLR